MVQCDSKYKAMQAEMKLNIGKDITLGGTLYTITNAYASPCGQNYELHTGKLMAKEPVENLLEKQYPEDEEDDYDDY